VPYGQCGGKTWSGPTRVSSHLAYSWGKCPCSTYRISAQQIINASHRITNVSPLDYYKAICTPILASSIIFLSVLDLLLCVSQVLLLIVIDLKHNMAQISSANSSFVHRKWDLVSDYSLVRTTKGQRQSSINSGLAKEFP